MAEFCGGDAAPRRQLQAAITQALALIDKPEPKVLDAGGGTGNASLILHELGIGTVIVDASPEMLAQWEAKARSRGIEPATQVADLETFFHEDARTWDLIVISSVLHHLADPAAMLVAAAGRLEPGGAIVTIFDPLSVNRTGGFLRRLDYGCWIAIHAPLTLGAAVMRRVRARLRPREPSSTSAHLPNVMP